MNGEPVTCSVIHPSASCTAVRANEFAAALTHNPANALGRRRPSLTDADSSRLLCLNYRWRTAFC
jgi:hypothetical protein